MSPSNISYLTFGIVLLLAVIFDLGLLSKKGATVTIRRALLQTAFWVLLALAFFAFLWYENGHKMALEYPERLPDGMESQHRQHICLHPYIQFFPV